MSEGVRIPLADADKAAAYLFRRWDLDPAEVYRYTPENRGWLAIERTGPREFGIAFLAAWKHRFGIRVGANRTGEREPASVKNHLRDAAGDIVPVRSEEEAFTKCGLAFVPPERRDASAAEWLQRSRR